ncbi:hypothetical protein RYX36_036587, partial [Vicia faba]
YYGSLGTSKPTHYHVLWDEHKFTSDELQKLIYEMCFTFTSYYGSLGTSKPTHYHVLWDEHKFTSDELQKHIYEMCFTFA